MDSRDRQRDKLAEHLSENCLWSNDEIVTFYVMYGLGEPLLRSPGKGARGQNSGYGNRLPNHGRGDGRVPSYGQKKAKTFGARKTPRKKFATKAQPRVEGSKKVTKKYKSNWDPTA